MRPDDALSPPTPVLERTVAAFADRYVCPSVPWGADPGPARAWVAPLLTGTGRHEDVSEEWLALPGGGGGHRIRVRILRPVGVDGPLPVVLFLHGLGWMLTDATEHEHLLADLALGAEAAVVVPEYDRAPEARYPVATEQVYAVARWITDRGADRRLDGDRIAVVGASAGANLAAALTLLAKERGGVRLVHQVLLCPVTDAAMDTDSYRDFAEGFFLGREAMRHFWDQYVPDPADRFRNTASPLRATDAELVGLPKALVVTAEADVLRDEGEGYAAKLRRAGVSVVSVRYHGTVHGFVLFDALRSSDASRAARTQTLDTLHEALHPWPM
ncbi:alpha/beta hydrolase [Streptomyces gibsoniae]|uniref:Alpha/beta hydrolase n=1 Tax=Streptomyces gibsoniae TaxID=3075529 RepID=A0ABU2U4J5_9ACTN|nr:alpha/beta hydrolase [Streptomyces sp. DSM 41699]MDT0468146.1 alpha/beta hydrolase [Streptomyces sp. DSM 41699]